MTEKIVMGSANFNLYIARVSSNCHSFNAGVQNEENYKHIYILIF